MKKSLFVSLFILGFSALALYAGTQYNWGTSTGGSWNTPDDTALTPNTFLVITGTGTPSVTTTGQPWLQSRTITQINGSTPTAVGQLVFCSNCAASPICISTSTAGSADGSVNPFVMVASTPGATGAVYRKCQ